MNTKPLPSQTELHRLFEYDEVTGLLRWRVRDDVPAKVNKRFAGKVAGALQSGGRIKVGVKGYGILMAHRIIWKMARNEEPPEIDHKNCIESDNKLANLRPATRLENSRNRRAVRDGLKGAFFHKRLGKWQSLIRLRGEIIYLGYYATEQEAHAAYVAAANKHHGEFARVA